jgi:uncharacterized delta-60 repeat protein
MMLSRVDASGVLDTSFGAAGMASNVACTGPGTDIVYALTIDPSGSIVAAGDTVTTVPTIADMATWRFTSDGQVDTNFGGDGCVVAASTAGKVPSYDLGAAVTEDANGNIVVGGYSSDPSGNEVCAMWRFLPAGSPDPSFGTNGAVVIPSAGSLSCTTIMGVVADSGGLLVAGFATDPSLFTSAFAARFTSAGAPDPTFGSGGFVSLNLANEFTQPWGLAVDSKGRILIAGELDSHDREAFVWRLSSTGVVDTTFGNQGVFSMSGTAGANPGADVAMAITVDAQDRPVIAGVSNANGNTDSYLAVWRLTP